MEIEELRVSARRLLAAGQLLCSLDSKNVTCQQRPCQLIVGPFFADDNIC